MGRGKAVRTSTTCDLPPLYLSKTALYHLRHSMADHTPRAVLVGRGVHVGIIARTGGRP